MKKKIYKYCRFPLRAVTFKHSHRLHSLCSLIRPLQATMCHIDLHALWGDIKFDVGWLYGDRVRHLRLQRTQGRNDTQSHRKTNTRIQSWTHFQSCIDVCRRNKERREGEFRLSPGLSKCLFCSELEAHIYISIYVALFLLVGSFLLVVRPVDQSRGRSSSVATLWRHQSLSPCHGASQDPRFRSRDKQFRQRARTKVVFRLRRPRNALRVAALWNARIPARVSNKKLHECFNHCCVAASAQIIWQSLIIGPNCEL